MRYARIDESSDLFPVARMCRLLDVSRSGFLQWRSRSPSERARANAALDVRVDAVHADSGRPYGRPRVYRTLCASGVRVGHERVRRSLRRQGLASVHRKPSRATKDSAHAHPIASNLPDRRFDGWAPDRVWVADIAHVPSAEGWLYLACLLDLGTRAVVG